MRAVATSVPSTWQIFMRMPPDFQGFRGRIDSVRPVRRCRNAACTKSFLREASEL